MTFLFREFALTEIESYGFFNAFDCQSYYSAASTRLRIMSEVRLRGNYVQTTVQILSLTTGWAAIYFIRSKDQSRTYNVAVSSSQKNDHDLKVLTEFMESMEAKILEKIIMLIDG